jgi:uncharacterized membrane protein YhaH (DUF805 family)
MFGYLDFLFLSYSGRIGRLSYWISGFVLGAAQIGAVVGLLALAHGTLAEIADADRATVSQAVLMHVVLPLAIVEALFLYPQFAIATKRWHDRGKSGWWSLITLVPLIGGLWYFVELGFLGGDDGVNAYGSR